MKRTTRKTQSARNFPPAAAQVSTREYIRKFYQLNFLGTPPYSDFLNVESAQLGIKEAK